MLLNLLKKYKKIFLVLLVIVCIFLVAFITLYQNNSFGHKSKTGKNSGSLFLGAGWNLGNSLDCYSDKLNPDTNSVSDYETLLRNPVTTKEMIQAVKEYGFTTIRIPVTWFEHMNEKGEVDEAFMNRVQEIVDYAMEGGKTYVILDTHHEDFLEPTEENQEKGGKRLDVLWRQIGARFSNYDNHLIFESMNEPVLSEGANRWSGDIAEYNVINKWNQEFVDTIRSLGGNNKKRTLIIPTYGNTVSENVMANLKIPNDDNLMVAVHLYLPTTFALNGQGTAKWSSDNPEDCRIINNYFNSIEKFCKKNSVPFVIDEMGARYKNNDETRAKWYSYVAKQAYNRGIACVIWDNGNAMPSYGEEFCFLNRNKLSWMHEDVLKEFMKVIYK